MSEEHVHCAYDGCGSLVRDRGKGINRIEYDLLGNPVRVRFSGGDVTEYVYDHIYNERMNSPKRRTLSALLELKSRCSKSLDLVFRSTSPSISLI